METVHAKEKGLHHHSGGPFAGGYRSTLGARITTAVVSVRERLRETSIRLKGISDQVRVYSCRMQVRKQYILFP